MAIRRGFVGLAIVSIFVIGIVFLGSVPQANAETLNLKQFTRVTKGEIFPIPDVEGHVINVNMREGVAVFEKGEVAWVKAPHILNLVKTAGTVESYYTYTFMDGSTFTVHNKGTTTATAAKITGDVVQGTGRFQGIKGTMTTSTTLLPVEKGELGPKGVSEISLVYTLPGK